MPKKAAVMSRIERRSFLKGIALAGGAAVGASAFQGLGPRAARAAAGGLDRVASDASGGYGELLPKKPAAVGPDADPDVEWLALPRGFDYAVLGVAGATMSVDGRYLFVNTQGETRAVANPVAGRTYAIWGPWENGAL